VQPLPRSLPPTLKRISPGVCRNAGPLTCQRHGWART
jgi:phenylpropionate dioxygenase-like ring-hydroxylating dioxygenase large terminal subunit